MSTAAIISLITQLLVSLPETIKTGREVMSLINDAYENLRSAIGDKEVTAEEINELVSKIVANSVAIQSF